jgi:hypothetical protein
VISTSSDGWTVQILATGLSARMRHHGTRQTLTPLPASLDTAGRRPYLSLVDRSTVAVPLDRACPLRVAASENSRSERDARVVEYVYRGLTSACMIPLPATIHWRSPGPILYHTEVNDEQWLLTSGRATYVPAWPAKSSCWTLPSSI